MGVVLRLARATAGAGWVFMRVGCRFRYDLGLGDRVGRGLRVGGVDGWYVRWMMGL